MAKPDISTIGILITIFFLICQKNVEAISCYICSWSPEDEKVESDRCTSDHFDERRVRFEECAVGCEVVKMTDSNGELLMFYRNCLMGSPNKIAFESGLKRSTPMFEEEMYACDSDLCNVGVTQNAHSAIITITAALVSSLSSPIFQVFS